MLQSLRKKWNNMSDKSNISISQWHLPAKVTPDIDFTDGPVVSCDNSVVENTFVGDCK